MGTLSRRARSVNAEAFLEEHCPARKILRLEKSAQFAYQGGALMLLNVIGWSVEDDALSELRAKPLARSR